MIRKLENRQIELLLILKEAEDFLPVHVIAEKMGVSTKTVYRDIEKLKTDSFFYREDVGRF